MVDGRKKLVDCTSSPLAGLWSPESHLKHLHYGPGCVAQHLIDLLQTLGQSRLTPAPSSGHVFIVTGATLNSKTLLIRKLETLLGERHAGTFASVKQHGHINDVDQAFDQMLSHVGSDGFCTITTIISVGGGSPIDSAKTLSHRFHEHSGSFLTHIAIPTTLSAAECTAGGGYTGVDGTKIGFMSPGMGVAAVFYDAEFTTYTPLPLLLSTGMRAVDHAVETSYHPKSSEMPWKALACWALGVLFEYLPRVALMGDGNSGWVAAERQDVLTRLQLAAFASSGLRGSNFGGGMGLSHALGHALGSPYGIPRKSTYKDLSYPVPSANHVTVDGETSCLTLAPVVRLMAARDENACSQISRLLLPALGGNSCGNGLEDSFRFADRIESLVSELGLGNKSLTDWGVERSQIPVIVQRALKNSSDEGLIHDVERLVEKLFCSTT